MIYLTISPESILNSPVSTGGTKCCLLCSVGLAAIFTCRTILFNTMMHDGIWLCFSKTGQFKIIVQEFAKAFFPVTQTNSAILKPFFIKERSFPIFFFIQHRHLHSTPPTPKLFHLLFAKFACIQLHLLSCQIKSLPQIIKSLSKNLSPIVSTAR